LCHTRIRLSLTTPGNARTKVPVGAARRESVADSRRFRFLLDSRNLLAGDDAGLGRAARAVNDDVLNRGSPMTDGVPRRRRRPRPPARPTPRRARARHPRTRKTSSPFAVPRALAPLPANHGCFYNASKKGSVRNKGQSAFSGDVFSPEKDALSCRCVSKAGNLNDNERATRRCARPRRARGSLPRVRLPDRFFSRNVAGERKVPLFRPLPSTSVSVTALLTRAQKRDTVARCCETRERAIEREYEFEAGNLFEDFREFLRETIHLVLINASSHDLDAS